MEDTLFLEHLLPDKPAKEKMPPMEPFTVWGGGWLEVQTKTFLCLHPWRSGPQRLLPPVVKQKGPPKGT